MVYTKICLLCKGLKHIPNQLTDAEFITNTICVVHSFINKYNFSSYEAGSYCVGISVSWQNFGPTSNKISHLAGENPTQQTRDIYPMLVQCWNGVVDDGPTLGEPSRICWAINHHDHHSRAQ